MTNEQIVAELGWTRKAIKAVLGITPLLMRPPYGDIGQLFNLYLFFLKLVLFVNILMDKFVIF